MWLVVMEINGIWIVREGGNKEQLKEYARRKLEEAHNVYPNREFKAKLFKVIECE